MVRSGWQTVLGTNSGSPIQNRLPLASATNVVIISAMTTEQIFHHTYENGLTLVAQPMPWLQSAAFSIAVPAGCRHDSDGRIGTANFVCEMVQRGCGSFNSREFIEALESLGVDYSSSASLYNTNFGGAMQS